MHKKLYSSLFDTQLGQMIAIADEQLLYLLEFIDGRGVDREIEKLQEKLQATIISGRTSIIDLIEKEMQYYFDGTLSTFTTPMQLTGSSFQQSVWHELQKIPYGQTISYREIATRIGNPRACRAVAQANGANQLAIIIPCHRVINANKQLGGYAGGVNRKQWLLNNEKNLGLCPKGLRPDKKELYEKTMFWS